MKKQRTLVSLLLAASLLATNAVAQTGGGGGGGGKSSGSKSSDKASTREQKAADASSAELEDLTSKLTLTDPQKAQKGLVHARCPRKFSWRRWKKEKLPKDESKDKSKAIKDATNAKIRTILTPDQQAIFDGGKKKGGKKSKDEAAPALSAATQGSPTP